jgi:YaiO family outer membrane protein
VALAPADGDALAARGRALSLLGRGSEALASYTRAVAASPRDPEIRFGREQAWRRTSHRADVIAAHETFDPDLPAADVVDVVVEATATDRLRLAGRAQIQRRFGLTEGRGGVAMEWRADRRTALRSSLLVSPGAASVARVDATGEVEQARGRWQPALTLRYLDFAAAHVWVLTPGLTVDLNDTVALVGRYTRSQTRFTLSDRQVGDNSVFGAVRWRARPRLWLIGGYARGYESFETFSADRLGRMRADTISLGVRIDARSGTTFAMTPEYQWRSGNRQMLRTTLAVSQHF